MSDAACQLIWSCPEDALGLSREKAGVISFPVANPEALAQSADYPTNVEALAVMSARMLDLLLKVGSFDHRSREVEVEGRRFVLIEAVEAIEAIDWERTRWQRTGGTIAGVEQGVVAGLVLRDVNFPPLFEVDGLPYLFVSAEARRALEGATLGPAFKRLGSVVGGVDLPPGLRAPR